MSRPTPRRVTWRGWLARFALAVGGPVLLFTGIEVSLRLAGFGHPADFFIPEGKPGVFRTNPWFTDQFFPPSFGLKPLNFRLPKQKPPGEFRVFVVGESAAMGVPEPGFGLAPQLRAQLRAAYPGRAVAVYNLGVTAINSHAILPIIRQVAEFQPDLFVVYMGNNEVVGPFGPGSVSTRGVPPRVVIRANLWVRGTRLGQLVQRALQAIGPAGAALKEWRGMEMFARNTVAAGDPRLEAVYANFAANLDEIIGLTARSGAKVVLSTVAVNVKDCAPFVSVHATGMTPEQLTAWQQAVDRGAFADALAIDPQHAESHFRLAQILDEQGQAELARSQYLAALQWDALRFRADARINDIIRAAARFAPDRVILVDAAREMGAAADSPTPPADSRFFLEHVHLTWAGNFELARLLAAGAAHWMQDDRQPWLSPAACAAAIGYTEFGQAGIAMSMDRLTSRPPFTGQLTFAAARGRLQEEIKAANRAVVAPGALPAMAAAVEEARRNDPGNTFLLFHEATMRAQLGEFATALDLNTRLAALEPAAPELVAQRAFLLQQLGRTDEAEAMLLQSAKDDPYYFQTYALLGWLWGAKGQWSRATEYFAGLTARLPGNLALRHAYARALAGSGDWRGAEEQWHTILQSTPDDEDALEPLCVRMLKDGRADAAIGLMLAAHSYNPRSYANNARLEQIYETKGDTARTIDFMRDLAASGPVNTMLHINLASLLRQAGRTQEAAAELRRAETRAQVEGNAAALATIRQMMRATGPANH
jgi:tetratricopeptide (TPR) repeat protein